MADDRIKLGLDASETTYQLDTVATKFSAVKTAAAEVAAAYDVMDREAADFLTRMRETAEQFGEVEEGVKEVAAEFQIAAERTQDLRHETIQLSDSVDAAGETYVVVADQFEQMVDDEVRAARKAEDAIDAMNRSKRRAATAADTLGGAAGNSAKRMGELSRGALQTSQALQDVAQGGSAAALNNVDGIVNSLGRGLGLTATAASVLSGGLLGLGTAALVFGPAIWSWVNALSKGNEEIPETKSAMDKLNESMATAKARVDAMKVSWSGTKEEVQKYKAAQAEVIALEKKAAEQKVIEAQKAKEAAGAKEVDKPYVEAASKAVEAFGGIDKFKETMERAQPTGLREDYARKIKEATAKRAADAQYAYEQSGYNHEEGDKAFDRGTKDIEVLQGLLKEAEAKRKADAASMTAKFLEGDVATGKAVDKMFPGRGFDVGGTVQKQRADELAAMQKQVAEKEQAEENQRQVDLQRKREQAQEESAKQEAEAVAKAEKDKADFEAEQQRAGAALQAEEKAAQQAAAEAAKAAQQAATRGVESDIDRGTGGQLTGEQVSEAAKRAQGYMAQGVNRDVAMDAAVRELIMANAELMRTIQELQNGTAQSVQAAKWQRQQASQMRQMNGSILTRGGG